MPTVPNSQAGNRAYDSAMAVRDAFIALDLGQHTTFADLRNHKPGELADYLEAVIRAGAACHAAPDCASRLSNRTLR